MGRRRKPSKYTDPTSDEFRRLVRMYFESHGVSLEMRVDRAFESLSIPRRHGEQYVDLVEDKVREVDVVGDIGVCDEEGRLAWWRLVVECKYTHGAWAVIREKGAFAWCLRCVPGLHRDSLLTYWESVPQDSRSGKAFFQGRYFSTVLHSLEESEGEQGEKGRDTVIKGSTEAHSALMQVVSAALAIQKKSESEPWASSQVRVLVEAVIVLGGGPLLRVERRYDEKIEISDLEMISIPQVHPLARHPVYVTLVTADHFPTYLEWIKTHAPEVLSEAIPFLHSPRRSS